MERWVTLELRERRGFLAEKDHLDPLAQLEGNRYVCTVYASMDEAMELSLILKCEIIV